MIRWNNVNAIYQIYPRSFQDSDGDGVGDLNGITRRLSYIKGDESSLGVDAIWISPIFLSPMADFGYDISDYREIDPIFGTLADFDTLIAEARKQDILVMLDFVPNHTSDQHKWFQSAISSKDSPHRDYYHFCDPASDGGPPNNWLSLFGGSAWEYDEASGQYYLHSFLKEQPDLNWENPRVRKGMANTLRFWLDRGVHGFRFDAIRWMSKDHSYPDDPINPDYKPDSDPYASLIHTNSRYGKDLDLYLKGLTDVVDEYDNTIVIFEDYNDVHMPPDKQIERLYAIDKDSSFPINLEPIHHDWAPRDFATNIARYQKGIAAESQMIMAVGNHDNPRIATRYGRKQARLVALIQLTLPGVPIIYYGDEIGMVDSQIASEDVRDPFELNVPGLGLGRDPQRTPMQWTDELGAGFTNADKAWLPINSNSAAINVISQQQDESSFLKLYKTLLRFRSKHLAMRSGTYEPILVGRVVYYYNISCGKAKFGIIANFSPETQGVLIQQDFELVLSVQQTATIHKNSVELPQLEGVIIRYL